MRLSVALLGVCFAACSFDLALPSQPVRSGTKGTLVRDDGSPVPGVTVTLTRASDAVAATQTTDADGAFAFLGQVPGDYDLSIKPAGFQDIARSFTLLPGITKDLGQIRLNSTQAPGLNDGQIDGKVSVQPAGDITGAEVEFTVESTQQRVAVATVGASGEFSQRLPPNTYTLTAKHPYYASPSPRMGIVVGDKQTVDLKAMPLVLTLNPARIQGKVLKERDLAAAPFAAGGVTVTSDTGATATTDQTGAYDVMGLPAGRRTLTFTLDGFHDPIGTRAYDVAPLETKQAADVELLLDRGDINGEVLMKDNTPLRDVTASLDIVALDGGSVDGGTASPYSAAVAPSATQPSRGSYTIRGVPIGAWSVKASRDNYITATSGAVAVAYNRGASAGVLELVRIQGDFTVDDGDALNTPGFTRTQLVTLRLTSAGNASEWRASEVDPTLASANFAAFGALPDGGMTSPTSIPFMLSPIDGTKSIYLQYKDATGNISGILSANIVLDTVAPGTLSLELADGAQFTRSSSTLLAAVSAIDPRGAMVDNASGVGFVKLSATSTLDASGQLAGAGRKTYSPNLTFDRPTTADGPQTVYAQFIDNAGNASALVSDSVVIDTVPPSTGGMTITRGPKATLDGYTNTPLVELQLSAAAEPNGGYVQVKLANETAADLSAAVLQPLRTSLAWFIEPTEGARHVHVVFVDAAGNVGTQLDRTITYDTTPPSGTLTLTSSAQTNVLPATFTIAAADSNGNPMSPTQALTLSEDPAFATATPGPLMTPATFTLSAGDGNKVVYARFRDAAGNDSTATAAVTLDQTAPSGTLAIEGTLADGTVSSTITSTPTVTLKVQSNGATLILLGNESLTTCPASAASYVPLTSATITGHALTGTAVPRQVRACLRDGAGNTVLLPTATVSLDTSQPTGCQLSLVGRKVDGTAAPAAKTALRDITANIGSCVETPAEIFLTESMVTCSATAAAAWVPFSSSFVYSLTGADGATTVRGCVRDAARNTQPIGSAPMTLDTTPPTVSPTIVIDTGAAYVNQAQVTARGGNIASVVGTAAGATEWALSETNPPVTFSAFTGAATSYTFGGTGLRTLYGVFRDDVGNTTSVAQDSIDFDVTPPTGAGGVGAPSILVVGTLADGTTSTTTTSSTTVTVQVTAEGASEYVLGNEALVTCPASGYSALSTLTLNAQTLSGAASPRQMRACFRDAAGNTVGPFTDTIVLDGTAPTGCVLTLNGTKRDGSAASVDRTANADISVAVAGCVETPLQIYLTEQTPVCSATVSLPWQTFTAPVPSFLLSGGDGTHTVRGCVRDAAGNVTTVTSDFIVLDTTPPSGTTLLLNAGATYINAAQVSGGVSSVSVSGTAAGATEWAVAESATPSTFIAFGGSTTYSMPGTDGTHTVNALFRDDLLNTTAVVTSDSIVVDTTAPVISSLVMDVANPTAPVAGFTNTEAVTVTVLGANDAVDAFLAEHVGGGGCTGADFAMAPRQSVVSSYGFVLSGGETSKRICLRYRDAAGNGSSILEDGITLDKTPPTTPQFSNQDQYTNHPNLTPFITNIVQSVDTNFYTYEKLGGLDSAGSPITSWTPTTSLPGQPTRFQYFEQNDGGETGVRNELRLRAKDNAGNLSGEATVVVHADSNPPDPITWKPEWVDNGNAKATVYFQPSNSGDLDHYRVYYGAAPTFADNENAGFANEGVSPVRISPRPDTTLSGLPNGAATYVRIRPVDVAGNVGDWLPDAGTTALRLQPGEVSANEIAVVTLPGSLDRVHRFARAGNVLYAAATTSNCGPSSPSNLALHVVDMKELMSPVQSGQARPTVNNPVVSTTLVYGDAVPCSPDWQNADLIVDGHWMYLLGPRYLRIFELSQPLAPTLYATLDLSVLDPGVLFRAVSMSLLGDKLVISGRHGSATGTFVTVLSLAELYDSDSVAVSTANVVGGTLVQAGAYSPTAAAVTRDRVVLMARDSANSTLNQLVNITATLNMAVTPTFVGAGFNGPTAISRWPMSGNLGYFAAAAFGLSSFPMSGTWLGGPGLTPSVNSAYVGAGQLEVAGHQIFLPDDGAGLRTIDFSQPTFTRDVGLYSVANPTTVITFGNYSVLAATGGPIRFLELATPRALRTFTSDPGAGYAPAVLGGFLYTGHSYVFDLQAGLAPTRTSNPPQSSCTLGAAYDEDVEVNAAGSQLRIYNLEPVTDRDAATLTASGSNVALNPGSGRPTDMELFGGTLVVAEVRTTGVFLDLFRAGKLRNRSGATLTAADSFATVQVASFATLSSTVANLSMTAGGRVAVGIESNDGSNRPSTGTGNNLYFVELNALLDDVAGGAAVVHGPVVIDAVLDTAMQGNYAYVATVNGLSIIDISAVMDAVAGTLLPGSPNRYNLLTGNAFDGIWVMGSTVLVTPTERNGSQPFAEGIYSIDVSTPSSPSVQGYFPVGGDFSLCIPIGDAIRRAHSHITVAGSRAYYTSGGTLRTLDLE